MIFTIEAPSRPTPRLEHPVRANPKKYQYASAGSGTLNHLLGEMLNQQGKLQLEHIPYKGVAPATSDVLGNQVPILFASLPSEVEAVKAGRLKALGVSSLSRVALLPEVPAIAEQLPGFSGDLWVALYAPRETPTSVIKRLHGAVKTALASHALLFAPIRRATRRFPGSLIGAWETHYRVHVHVEVPTARRQRIGRHRTDWPSEPGVRAGSDSAEDALVSALSYV